MKNKKGFTLVELLVVITIIAILTTIGLTIYSSTQKAGRTAKRIGDLKAIQTALELYYSVNKSYPTTNVVWKSECYGQASDQVVKDVVNNNLLVPTYMPAFPADPSMNKTAGTSCYLYESNGTDYKLLDFQISEFSPADIQSQRNLIDPARDDGTDPCKVDGGNTTLNGKTWALYSSSTSACW